MDVLADNRPMLAVISIHATVVLACCFGMSISIRCTSVL